MDTKSVLLYISGIYCVITYEDLSFDKKTSQFPSYIGRQYEADNAVDRNFTTCMRTHEVGSNAAFNTTWWKVDLGGIVNIYKIHILFKSYDGKEIRQQSRFAGFSLYVSDIDNTQNYSLCYKDGPNLPPLNFTTICSIPGRYFIYKNERLPGVSYPTSYSNPYTELCEVIVQGCFKSNVYGSQCEHPCPSNCKDNRCHIENGTCFTCKPGWTDTRCNTGCTDGWYGVNCSKQCEGHCRDGAICDHVTGLCDKGCALGWTGSLCNKECNDVTYGYNCVNNCSGHCLNNYPCNKQTGHCDGGCDPGYKNDDCNDECSSGHYGMHCKEHCSGSCINNEPCNNIDGVCRKGCKDGYFGSHCNNTCKDGNYGKDCSFLCSPNCKTCRHTDGLCTCKAGWKGKNCTEKCVMSYGESCLYPCSKLCLNQTCDRFNGSCVYGCEDKNICAQVIGSNSLYSSNFGPAAVGGTVGGCILFIIGVLIAVFVLRLRRKAKKITKRQSIVLENRPRFKVEHEPSFTTDERFQNDHAHASHEKAKRGPPTSKNISVRNIKAQIANMSTNENAGFKSEYQDIPRGELHPSLEAKKPENKVKNRYTTIYPYDHSRIVLKTLAMDEEDYINANYIEDARGKRNYIATQGPKPKTISDFWTMIWQEEVCNIVCLTNLKEGTKNKCAQYWPDVNDKLQGGTLTVRHLEEKPYAEYTMRRFKIHNKTTRTDRNVTMFHFTTWSDHGVADPLSLVLFHSHVIRATANSAGKYTVVHCSAGVGRTGTYIALDALYREGERTGKINVPMYVRTMRKDRMNMIQGDEQYKLLYLALMEAFSGPSRCMTTEKFVGAYQEQTCYSNCGDVVQKSSQPPEFEELLSLRKEYTQQDYISGRAQISANYTQSVLPVEEFMCHLSYIKGHNTYYNAVLIQSYLEKDSLISAQYPLPDNTEDFLRLVKDFDARVVVFLCPLKDIESTPAWFPTDNQSKLNGLFFIKNISTIKVSNVSMAKLNIQPQGFSEMNITVIECPTWREGKWTADKRVLLDVIKAVKTEKSDQEGRIIVLSSDGATRCGPFFVVYNMLEQISVDREVDIFTTARQLQVRRPEFVSTLEEYQLCHDTVAEYLLNDCVYGNC